MVVARGYAADAAAVAVTDPYAAQGWATRNFYTPYWMGMAPRREMEAAAKKRAAYHAAAMPEAIVSLAKRQAAKPVSASAGQAQLKAAIEQARARGLIDKSDVKAIRARGRAA